MTRFVQWPLALLLVLLLPLFGMLVFRIERRSRAVRLAKLGTPSMLLRLAPFGARFGYGRMLRIVAVLGCCGLAFAGPRWGIEGIFSHSTGVDVAVVLDASLSMMAPDAPPTRLDNAKNVVRQLLAASPNDRFALSAFAAHSYTLSPLTTDKGALEMYLTNLDTATVGVRGTSLSSAIHDATTLLRARSGDKSRVVVLLGDGEDFEAVHDLVTEAESASAAGITLITVGVGTERGATIPIRSSRGGMTVMRDTAGQTVITHYVPFFLKRAAEAGHGIFIPANAPNKAVQIRHVLDGLKPEARTLQTGEVFSLRFQWFLLAAFFLLLLDTLLVLRPRRRTLSAAATATAALAMSGCVQAPQRSTAAHPPRADYASMIIYNRGTNLLVRHILDAFTTPRDSAAAGQIRQELADAIPLLDSAGESQDTSVQFRATFNSAWSSLVSGMTLEKELIWKKRITARGDTVITAANNSRAIGEDACDCTVDKIPTDSIADAVIAGDTTGDDTDVATSGATAAGDAADQASSESDRGVPAITPAQAARVDSINNMLAHMDNARVKYRAALLLNANDMDAKWNYELALQHDKAGMGKIDVKKKGKCSSKAEKRGSELGAKAGARAAAREALRAAGRAKVSRAAVRGAAKIGARAGACPGKEARDSAEAQGADSAAADKAAEKAGEKAGEQAEKQQEKSDEEPEQQVGEEQKDRLSQDAGQPPPPGDQPPPPGNGPGNKGKKLGPGPGPKGNGSSPGSNPNGPPISEGQGQEGSPDQKAYVTESQAVPNDELPPLAPVQKLKLPPQEAEQILNSIGQHALKAPKGQPNTRTPRAGKTW